MLALDFAVGELVFTQHEQNKRVLDKWTAADLDGPMVIVDVIRANAHGLGANEKYRCLCSDGALRNFYSHELVRPGDPNAVWNQSCELRKKAPGKF
jgi:hypothetical protein